MDDVAVLDPECVCGHTAATTHDIVTDQQVEAMQFGPCAKHGCHCAQFIQKRPYTGACDSCRAYWNTGQDLAAQWYAAPRADQPPISNQIARALAMYAEHAFEHVFPTTTEN